MDGNKLIDIKNELGANYINNTEKIIINLYEETYLNALNISNLKSLDKEKKLYPYVKEAVKAKYNRLGAEGFSSSSEGSESYNFIDIEEKLRNDIIMSGLRRLR